MHTNPANMLQNDWNRYHYRHSSRYLYRVITRR